MIIRCCTDLHSRLCRKYAVQYLSHIVKSRFDETYIQYLSFCKDHKWDNRTVEYLKSFGYVEYSFEEWIAAQVMQS